MPLTVLVGKACLHDESEVGIPVCIRFYENRAHYLDAYRNKPFSEWLISAGLLLEICRGLCLCNQI